MACVRLGGGALSEVLSVVGNHGLVVLSSLRSPPGGFNVVLGRATFDPATGDLTQQPLPPLDADGAPGWLFWAGDRLTATAAAHWLGPGRGALVGGSTAWLELCGQTLTSHRWEPEGRQRLEAAWCDTWPLGSVFVGFTGTHRALATLIGRAPTRSPVDAPGVPDTRGAERTAD